LVNAGVKAELHLAGSTHPEAEHRAYYLNLIERAAGLPVFFHANCSDQKLRQLYRDSAIYWHAAGFGNDIKSAPHTAEHFGISVVEAMSARCIPVVFAAGGPADIVVDGVTGFHFRTQGELVKRTSALIQSMSQEERDTIADAAERASCVFDTETFKVRVRQTAVLMPT
jgi:glycosyltransferase involved in cell wall biosynthesis